MGSGVTIVSKDLSNQGKSGSVEQGGRFKKACVAIYFCNSQNDQTVSQACSTPVNS